MNYRDHLHSPCPIVHRGLCSHAPENSLSALEAAIAAGHSVLEIDIRATADGVLVLMHDDSLLRMTGLDQPVESMTSADLSWLRLHDGHRIPRLTEALELCRDRACVHLDAKDRRILPEVIATATRMGMAEQVDVWGDLRSSADLGWFRQVVPKGMLRMARLWLDAPDIAAQTARLHALHPEICELRFAHPDQIAAFAPNAQGVALMANTLPGIAPAAFDDRTAPETTWRTLIAAGVTLIQTDEACALRRLIQQDRP